MPIFIIVVMKNDNDSFFPTTTTKSKLIFRFTAICDALLLLMTEREMKKIIINLMTDKEIMKMMKMMM